MIARSLGACAVPFLVLALFACGDDTTRPISVDGGMLGAGFGEPCTATEHCASGLCLAIDASGRGICTHVCTLDSECPSSPSWGCVSPVEIDVSVCGCVRDADAEVCGDGLDNDCNGAVDDCRLCFGMPVPEDNPRNCGACGNACRVDQRCQSGSCVCSEPGTIDCDGECVDVATDARHCGACGTACGAGQVCEGSACVCPDPLLPDFCAGVGCVDLSSDRSYCGACGTACAAAQVCADSACSCPYPGDRFCGATTGCVDTGTNEENCGTCGMRCAPSEECNGGVCGCPAARPDICGGACVSLADDPMNCGACGTVCPSGTTCFAGACTCSAASTMLCGSTCVRTDLDTANCGACGNRCIPGEGCVRGVCTCGSGLVCGGTCVPVNDPLNCGTCGNTCATGAGQYCSAGTCRCTSSVLTPCGAACVSTTNDPANCGGCGNACRPTEICTAGTCRCPTGQTWCDAVGACVNLSTDTSNCGACGNACDPTEICSGGTCRCSLSGYLYCASSGACIDTRSNVSNCGMCDRACNPSEFCISGTCRCPTSGQLYCASAGTCVNVTANPAHCGACDRMCPADATCTSSRCVCTDSSLTVCGTSCVDLMTDEAHCGACGQPCMAGQTCYSGMCTCGPPVRGTEVRVTNDTVREANPRTASGGSTVGAVWTSSVGTSVQFVVLDATGNPVTGSRRSLSATGRTPDIVWTGSQYVVSYVDYVAPTSHLFLERFDAMGAPVGTRVDVTMSSALSILLGERLAYSPASGFAVATDGAFQYLGMDGTSAAPIFNTGLFSFDFDVAASPTGEFGVVYYDLVTGTNFFRFSSSGTVVGTPTELLTGSTFSDPYVNITHDGVTWLAAIRDEGPAGNRVVLMRGPTLATVSVVRVLAEPGGDQALFQVSVDVRGSEAVVAWAEITPSTFYSTLYARRYQLPRPRDLRTDRAGRAVPCRSNHQHHEPAARELHGRFAIPRGLGRHALRVFLRDHGGAERRERLSVSRGVLGVVTFAVTPTCGATPRRRSVGYRSVCGRRGRSGRGRGSRR